MASTETPAQQVSVEPAAETIADDDLLARHVFYPNAQEAAIVGENTLVRFMGNRNEDGSFSESLLLERLIDGPTIHALGCEAAKGKNNRLKLKREGKGLQPAEPVSGEDRQYYCGYLRAPAAPLHLKTPRYQIELAVEEDNGVAAHVALYLRPSAPDTKLNGNDKTEAGRLLALKFSDPQAHVCPEDVADTHQPINKLGPAALTMKDAA
jgi:hypothetical protein